MTLPQLLPYNPMLPNFMKIRELMEDRVHLTQYEYKILTGEVVQKITEIRNKFRYQAMIRELRQKENDQTKRREDEREYRTRQDEEREKSNMEKNSRI